MIAILKYNAGNIRSVENAVTRLGYEVVITDRKEILRKADKVIFPGVGEASSAMRYLIRNHLHDVITQLSQPVLGICLGMQLLCRYSEEGNTEGLGIFNSTVRKFPPKDLVPHIGWNNLIETNGELFQNIPSGADFYFVHSYYADKCEDTTATTQYILPFSSALQKKNFYAVQFHPEKSGSIGLQLLKNFLEL